MKKLFLFLLTVVIATVAAVAQNRTVTGTVVYASDGEPLIGATVTPVGGGNATATNFEGKFSLVVPNTVKYIQVSYVGMITRHVEISDKPLHIELTNHDNELDEVMVVAYGTATRSSFTGSASVVNASQIEGTQVTNPVDALKGRVAGVQINTASGAPGNSSPNIRIRGISSINAGNQPLIVLDGTPFDGSLDNISTQDIESMTVLKDAASNALYGARGANGVILITTKRGKQGEARVTVDAKWGGNSRAVPDYDVISDPAQYIQAYGMMIGNYLTKPTGQFGMTEAQALPYVNQAIFSAVQNVPMANGGAIGIDAALGYNVFNIPEGQGILLSGYQFNPAVTIGRTVNYNGQEYLLRPDNWADAAYQNALRQEYNVSISQGNERGSFFLSTSYLDNEGISVNSGYKRFTGRLSADYQVKKWLKVGANMSYTNYHSTFNGDDGSSGSSGNIFAVNNSMSPVYPLYVRDGQGNIMTDEYGNTMYDYGDGMNAGNRRPIFAGANPISANILDVSKYNGNATDANAFAEIRFLNDFKFTTNNSVNIYDDRQTNVTNPYYGSYKSSNGIVYKYSTRRMGYTFQQLLTWGHQFGEHKLDVLVGHENYWNKYDYLYASRSNMLLPSNQELDGAITDGSASSYRTLYNNEGWFGRINYDLMSRYFISASLRRDASSRFDPDHRWGTFWSASAAWLLNKEAFFNVSWVDELKVKLSYGEQGNDNIGNFRYTDTYTIVNSGGVPSAQPNTLGNRNISWEKGGNLNYGIDFSVLNERISGSIEGFYRKTTDMLFSFPLPPSYGYTSFYDNIGDMTNTGLEIDLRGDIIRTRDIVWSVNANMTYYKNKITRLPDERKTMTVDGVDGYSSGSYFYGEGESLYTWRVKRWAGVNPETGAARWWKNTTDADGNITGREMTENYSESDWYLCGTALPSVYGGFGTSVNAFGFDLSLDFTYQIGGKVYDNTYASLMSPSNASSKGYALHKDVLNGWSPTNTGSSIPMVEYEDRYQASTSDRFLTSASYVALQNINFGYTIPAKITRKVQIDRLRVYFTAENVALWSKRKGLDPRQSLSGDITNAYYSPIRTLSGGVNITF